MSKTILVVGGGIEAVPGIELAKAMGLHVVVSDIDPEAPGMAAAGHGIVADTYGVEETVSAAARYHRQVRPIDGVLSVAADVPLTVAGVAEAMGLTGLPVEAARLSADKLEMKRRFEGAGLPVPWYAPVESVATLEKLVGERGYPLIIKPVDSRGARGVLLLTGSTPLPQAYQAAREHSPSGRVMAEEFLAGPQISTESVLLGDGSWTPGFADRNYEHLERFSPYVIENGGSQPSKLSPRERREVSELAEEAGRVLGVRSGTVKGDMVLTASGAAIVEAAPRLSGGWLSSDQVPLATGVDIVGAAIRLALGEPVGGDDLEPTRNRGVAIRYFFPRPGRIVSIEGAEKFRREPRVHRLAFFLRPGEVVGEVTDHAKRAGYVITTGEGRDEAVDLAEAVCRAVKIATEPA
jgi:biotin carboxylase